MTTKSDFINNIKPDVNSTWQNRFFLTLDTDWAHDEIIEDTFQLIQEYKIYSTVFITNKSDVFSSWSKSKYINYGIHPNFKPIVLNNISTYSIEEEVSRLMNICPEAKAVRAHSLIQGSPFQNVYKKYGLTHESNIFIPYYSGISLKPFKSWNDLISIPYGWEDDVVYTQEKDFAEYSYPTKLFHKSEFELLVYNFHPIHIFLNTELPKRYEDTREIHNKPSELIRYRYHGYGTRNRFIDILKLISK